MCDDRPIRVILCLRSESFDILVVVTISLLWFFRVADDMGKLRFQFRFFHKPLFGWKCSFVVTQVRLLVDGMNEVNPKAVKSHLSWHYCISHTYAIYSFMYMLGLTNLQCWNFHRKFMWHHNGSFDSEISELRISEFSKNKQLKGSAANRHSTSLFAILFASKVSSLKAGHVTEELFELIP